jgi:hypothetical protein
VLGGEKQGVLNIGMKATLNALLALVFASISIGAAMDGRRQAWPLALTFGAFAAYSVVKVVRLMRSKQTRKPDAEDSSDN